MSNQKQLKQEIQSLNSQVRRLQQEKQTQEHQYKKALLQANTKLDFQTRKAQEYEQKYKSTMQYKNQEQSVKELDEKLRSKQDEIIKLMRLDHQKSQEIQVLLDENEQLKKQNFNLSNDLNQIKQAALNAIMDKDTTISDLTEKLDQFQNSQNLNHLKGIISDLEERYRDLEDKFDSSKNESILLIEGKDEQINQLQEKVNLLKDRHDERVIRFEQEIADYQKHIQQMTAEKDYQANFQEKYYHTEQKLRKAEKKFIDFQQRAIEERNDLLLAIQKLQQEKQNSKTYAEELKQLKKKISTFESSNSSLKNQLHQYKEKLQKSVFDHNKKVNHLESEKKIISDNLVIKIQEIERLKAEAQEKNTHLEPTLTKQKSSSSLVSPQKSLSDDTTGLIQKLKKQNKDLEEANESLKRKIEEQTKQLQQSRQKLLQARGSESSAQTNKLLLQIEDLTSYLKKVENDMLTKKITHAEDENFWSIKEKKYKHQIENLNKKYKKQNSELLERIDRMKRLIPKDKKTDYYQSGFK